TQMAAGLGLARSGSAKGLKYVRDRLADTSGDPNNPNETRTTNAEKDNPYGPKATDFILDHLGVSADEIFVPDLIRIASSPEYSWVRKAQAWRALSRLNPVADRQKILALAWKNLTDSSAVKLIVLNEESRVATVSRQLDSSSDGKEKATARELRRALATTSRERRRWREIHGYTF
ncbi:MAG TPA: hypothetical protein VFW15_04690, partial [Thermoanaerobaculia bacterium]|nr:hypothetical protein [Thermoanaerobaculia bacterium]